MRSGTERLVGDSGGKRIRAAIVGIRKMNLSTCDRGRGGKGRGYEC